MQETETTTVAIKKTDIEFLKTYVYGVDSAVQELCMLVLSSSAKDLLSERVLPHDAKQKRLKIGKISLSSSESRYQVLKILSEAK